MRYEVHFGGMCASCGRHLAGEAIVLRGTGVRWFACRACSAAVAISPSPPWQWWVRAPKLPPPCGACGGPTTPWHDLHVDWHATDALAPERWSRIEAAPCRSCGAPVDVRWSATPLDRTSWLFPGALGLLLLALGLVTAPIWLIVALVGAVRGCRGCRWGPPITIEDGGGTYRGCPTCGKFTYTDEIGRGDTRDVSMAEVRRWHPEVEMGAGPCCREGSGALTTVARPYDELLHCPECGMFYLVPAHGPAPRIELPPQEARARFPQLDWVGLDGPCLPGSSDSFLPPGLAAASPPRLDEGAARS